MVAAPFFRRRQRGDPRAGAGIRKEIWRRVRRVRQPSFCGRALRSDFRKPPLTLVGHNHAADASGTIALYQAIDALPSALCRRDDEHTSNTWHALKVVFANEIGNLCRSWTSTATR